MTTREPPDAPRQALQHENERLRRAVEELSILNDLSLAVSASRDVQEIMHAIIRRSLRAIRAEQAVITLVGQDAADPTHTFIRTSASSGDHEAYRSEQSLLGWMHLYKGPLLINDPAHDERFRGTRWQRGIHSVLCVPMIVQNRLIGILTLYNKKEGGFTRDDQRLLAILAGQSAQAIENARLQEEEKKLIRLREEYRLAFEIQTNLLPKEPPACEGYDIAGVSLPAQTVGGDYFDFIRVDRDRLGLCVGDVSGKGLPAAMLMANVQATLRGQALAQPDSVRDCIAHSNDMLCRSIGRGSFVTLFFGLLDARTHTLRYVNAGHNRPLLHTADGRIRELPTSGLVLGFQADFSYQEADVSLASGDTLLIYSDGITEAMNDEREQFDTERLGEMLRAHAHTPAATLIERIIAAVRRHTGEVPPNDDMTMLAVRRTA
ncbi:PP2C family protein-serine/threonine phosphatase [Rhodocaloribacter sp.]